MEYMDVVKITIYQAYDGGSIIAVIITGNKNTQVIGFDAPPVRYNSAAIEMTSIQICEKISSSVTTSSVCKRNEV